jgi:hypothetical protein
MKNRATRAYRLADNHPIDLETRDGKTTITMERPMPDPMATVVVDFLRLAPSSSAAGRAGLAVPGQNRRKADRMSRSSKKIA